MGAINISPVTNRYGFEPAGAARAAVPDTKPSRSLAAGIWGVLSGRGQVARREEAEFCVFLSQKSPSLINLPTDSGRPQIERGHNAVSIRGSAHLVPLPTGE